MTITALTSCNLITPAGSGHEYGVTGYLTTSDRRSLLQPVDGLYFGIPSAGGDDTITVNDQVKYQQMDGFGASLTESAAYVLCSNLTATEMTNIMIKLFDRSQGIGLSILRQPIGASDFALTNYSYDDMPAGLTDINLTNFSISRDSNGIIPLLKYAMSLNSDLRILSTPWSPPGWMRTGDKMVQGGSLKASAYDPYARYFVKYIQAYSSIGIPVYAVTVQNEPEYEPLSNAGMLLSAAEEADFIKNNLGPAFAANSIDTKILCYDHNWTNTNHATAILEDPAALNYLSGSAWHSYAGDPVAMTKVHDAFSSYGMGIWFTEGGSGTWVGSGADKGTWKTCFQDQVHNLILITKNWAKTVIWWNLALDQSGGPCVYSNTNNYGIVRVNSVSKTVETPYMSGYYSLAHVSKFVRPGAYRVDTTNSTGQLESVAFKNSDGNIVLLIYNPSDSFKVAKVNWKNYSFLYQFPGGSAVTFTWNENYSAFPVLTNDLAVQDFENYPAALVNNNNWGTGSVLTVDSNLIHQGSRSMKHTTTGVSPWVGIGLTNFTAANAGTVDLKPVGSLADRIVFWARATPNGGYDNSIQFQIADNGNYPVGSEWTIWSDQTANPVKMTNNTWVKVEVLFSEMTNSSGVPLDIHNVRRVQFSNYWPGVYYYDEVFAGHYTNY